ncbi:MAG: DUF2062 domain-containing protein [Deltaproteobacteria bacterium]|nr:DUF2062 domain-containing protein [Deltaproteobacteria bacterium]
MAEGRAVEGGGRGGGAGDPRVLVAIPVYNHAATLRSVAERARAVHPDVLVVDDGSTDGGAETLGDLDVRLVRHAENRGKGEAILTAAREARRLGMTHVVTLDADGQHDPADLPRLFAAVREVPDAIVVGVRGFEGAGVPAGSRFGRSFSNFWLRVQTGRRAGDTQSGYRAYPVAVLTALRLRERRYSFEVEVLVRAVWAGVDLRDVDVAVYYPPGKSRVSHFRLFLDNLRLTALNTRLTVRSMVPWPHRKLLPDVDGEVSLLHPLRSLRWLLTENATPSRLALAGAVGVLLGTLPLVACHTVAILFAAALLRLNRVAALSTSQLCAPPLVPALCIEVGYYLRHGRFLTEVSLDTLGRQGLERLYEWVLGSLALAPVLAVVLGAVVYILARFVAPQAHARA